MLTPQAISPRVPPSNCHSGTSFLLRLGIPHRVFQRSLGHAMLANPAEQQPELLRRMQSSSRAATARDSAQSRPMRPRCTPRCRYGLLAGDTFAPAFQSVAMQRHQHDAAGVGAPKARLEEVDERHVQFAEGNGFNFHRKGLITEWALISVCHHERSEGSALCFRQPLPARTDPSLRS